MWNWNAREPTAAFGYDYILRQCRLRGRIDTEGKVPLRPQLSHSNAVHCSLANNTTQPGQDLARHVTSALQVAAYLEERLNVGVNFLLSAELDHIRKDFKFGFGLTVGE